MDQSLVVGLTGQTGAGKSTVSALFLEQGVAVIDADTVAHEVISTGSECLVDMVIAFGVEILAADGTLDRARTGSIVFSDREKLKKLNAITFPHIIREIERRIIQHKKTVGGLLILDAPTLFESKADRFCDKVISVIAQASQRQFRIMQRDHLSEFDAVNRMKSQGDDAFYISRSDYVIENNEGVEQLRARSLEVLRQLERLLDEA